MRISKPAILIILGALLGLCVTFNLWLVYFCAIAVLCLAVIRRAFNEREAGFLVKLFLVSLLLRVFAVLVIRPFIILYGNGLDIFGDGMVYCLNSLSISEVIKGNLADIQSQVSLNKRLLELIPQSHLSMWNMSWVLPDWAGKLPPVELYQVGGFVYFLSALYYFFGFKPLLGILMNSLMGAGLGILAYYTIRQVSDNIRVSRFCALLASFFPSLFLWSITNQKETPIIFLSMIIVICLISILKYKKWSLLFIVAALTFVLYFLRPKFALSLLLWYIMIFAFLFPLWAWRRKAVSVFLMLSFVTAMAAPSSRALVKRSVAAAAARARGILITSLIAHKGNVIVRGNYYKILDERYYSKRHDLVFNDIGFGDIAKAFVAGFTHFIFEPLPGRIYNIPTLVSYPQSMLNYFLLIFFLLGAVITLRRDPLIFLILFSYLFVFSFSIALNEGNIGGLVRHRDIVTPVFIIFASIGLWTILKDKRYNA